MATKKSGAAYRKIRKEKESKEDELKKKMPKLDVLFKRKEGLFICCNLKSAMSIIPVDFIERYHQ